MSESGDYPLLSLTRKPLIYSRFEFGGDDLLGFYQSYLPKDSPFFKEQINISERYHNAKDNPDLQKEIEEEYEFYKEKVIDAVNDIISTALVDKEEYTKKIMGKIEQKWHNGRERLRIVKALGGEEFCKTIPIIYPQKANPYFTIDDIPEGSSLAQYEDLAGRKGVLIKLRNKETGEFEVAWFSQRYRETCLSNGDGGFLIGSQSGDFWMGHGACSLEGVDDIVDFIHQVKPQPHKIYEFVI